MGSAADRFTGLRRRHCWYLLGHACRSFYLSLHAKVWLAAAASSVPELIPGYLLVKADLKQAPIPSTKQIILTLGGTRPSDALTNGIKAKLATYLEIDTKRVVADVKATDKSTVITVSLTPDPVADAGMDFRPSAKLLMLGKMSGKELGSLLAMQPAKLPPQTCVVSLFKDDDYGMPRFRPMAAHQKREMLLMVLACAADRFLFRLRSPLSREFHNRQHARTALPGTDVWSKPSQLQPCGLPRQHRKGGQFSQAKFGLWKGRGCPIRLCY